VTFLVDEMHRDCKRAKLAPNIEQIWLRNQVVVEENKKLATNPADAFVKEGMDHETS